MLVSFVPEPPVDLNIINSSTDIKVMDLPCMNTHSHRHHAPFFSAPHHPRNKQKNKVHQEEEEQEEEQEEEDKGCYVWMY